MITAEQIQQLLNAQNNNDFISVAKIANELLQIAPENDFLLQAKAIALFNLKNYSEAISVMKLAVATNPANLELQSQLANILLQGSNEESDWLYAKNILLNLPQNIKNLLLLTSAFYKLSDWINTKFFGEKTITLSQKSNNKEDKLNDKNFIDILFYLARSSLKLNNFNSAAKYYELLYLIYPKNKEVVNNLVFSLHCNGDAEKAYYILDNSDFDELEKLNHHIMLDNYCSFITCQQMGEIARRRADLIAQQIPQKNFDFDKYKQQFLLNFHENSKNFSENLVEKNSSPQKKLKIGVVVSTFMLNEWVSAIFRQLCKNHRQTLEIHLYLIRHDNSIVADKNHCDFYQSVQDITHLNDQQSADKIYNDGVHILISTISHAFYGRLPMFAMKPSPIQFSWINWFGTSGIPTMDYFPVSNFDVPNQQYAQQFNEKPLYFPDLWCLVPKNEMAEKFYKKRPFSENIMNKNIVFGNFNIPEKITPQTLKLWALALNAVENSQLIYMRGTLVDNALCEKYFQELAKYNVKNLRQRVQFIANKTREEYFDCYQHIDFVLDAFPASGGATIADSLQMSVPALTVTGNLVIGRMAGSFLKAVGLENWICQNETEFVEKVKYFAAPNQRKYLNDLHNNLREITLKSAICDVELFAKNFETKMWEIWNDFLNS